MPLIINSVDVATLGFSLSSAPGWLDSPPRRIPSAERANREGAILTGPILDGSRKIVLEGWIIGSHAAAARSNLDALRALIHSAQPASISFPDQPTRYVSAYAEAHSIDAGSGPSMIQRKLKTQISLMALSPYSLDINATTAALDGSANRLQLGDAPSRPVFTITGATNPVFTLFKYDGTNLGSLSSTAAPGTLIVDNDRKTITLDGSSIIGNISAGDFITLDPASSQLLLGASSGDRPYVTVSSGSGTTSFRRAWR